MLPRRRWAVLVVVGASGVTGCKSGASAGATDAAVTSKDAGAADAAGTGLDCSQDDPDWPSFNHDVCNTRSPTTSAGISATTVPKLAVKWTYSAAGEISATPA